MPPVGRLATGPHARPRTRGHLLKPCGCDHAGGRQCYQRRPSCCLRRRWPLSSTSTRPIRAGCAAATSSSAFSGPAAGRPGHRLYPAVAARPERGGDRRSFNRADSCRGRASAKCHNHAPHQGRNRWYAGLALRHRLRVWTRMCARPREIVVAGDDLSDHCRGTRTLTGPIPHRTRASAASPGMLSIGYSSAFGTTPHACVRHISWHWTGPV